MEREGRCRLGGGSLHPHRHFLSLAGLCASWLDHWVCFFLNARQLHDDQETHERVKAAQGKISVLKNSGQAASGHFLLRPGRFSLYLHMRCIRTYSLKQRLECINVFPTCHYKWTSFISVYKQTAVTHRWTFSCLYLVNIQRKHRTRAPLCPVSGGNPAALLLPCLRERGESRRQGAWFVSFVASGDSEGGSCVLGVIAHVIHTSPPPLYTSPGPVRRSMYPSEGFMELSSYPCLHLSTPPTSRSFVKHLDPKC